MFDSYPGIEKYTQSLFTGVFVALTFTLAMAPRAYAQQKVGTDEATAESSQRGLRLHSEIGVRVIPDGAHVVTDVGYRIPLFDSESTLLRDTWAEAGAATFVSPVYFWGGAYAEALPIQVLKLRIDAYYAQYFGLFGHVFRAEQDADGEFPLEDLDASHDVDSGLAPSGFLTTATATPRMKIGGLVFLAPIKYGLMSQDIDAPYYEPEFDVVMEPTDTFWQTKPTLGYMIPVSDGHLLPAVRFAHTHTFDADFTRQLLLGVMVWKPPTAWWEFGHPEIAVAGGAWLEHTSRDGDPYIGAQLTLSFGAGH